MAVKVQELIDNAIVNVQVNKAYYLMVKHALYNIFSYVKDDTEREEMLQGIKNKEYKDMTDWQKTFYTMSLLLAEIERSAKEMNLVLESEIPEEGDAPAPTTES